MSAPRKTSGKGKQGSKDGGWGCAALIVIFMIVLVVADVVTDLSDDDDSGVPLGGGLFGYRGAGHLVERLNDATRAQQICYGWEIDTDVASQYRGYTTPVRPSDPAVPLPADLEKDRRLFDDGRTDRGSNLGTHADPRRYPQSCPRWVVFIAYYDAFDGEWTSVRTEVRTNLPISIGEADLTRAGISRSELLGSQATARLADAIGVLPMIVAEKGAAPAVPQLAASVPAPGDKVSSPGIARYVWMGIGGVLIAVGLVWIFVAAVRSSRRSA